MSMGQL